MPRDYSDILTTEDVKLIQDALKLGYKPERFKEVESDALKFQKEHPIGTSGSAQAYTRDDGRLVEVVAASMMKKSSDPAAAKLGTEILKRIDSIITASSEEVKKLRDLEYSSPMAQTFRVAHKLRKNGRDSESF